MTPMTPMTPLDSFLEQCCVEIERRAAVNAAANPLLSEGAQAFRIALADATPMDARSATMPVVEQLLGLTSWPLLSALIPAIGSFPWVDYPAMGDGGTEVALGRVNHVRDFGDVDCGLMLIGAGCTYPLHHHPPQELYLPIAGRGKWRVGGAADFRDLGADDLPYNNPHDVHSVRAGGEPLLAMFVLWP